MYVRCMDCTFGNSTRQSCLFWERKLCSTLIFGRVFEDGASTRILALRICSQCRTQYHTGALFLLYSHAYDSSCVTLSDIDVYDTCLLKVPYANRGGRNGSLCIERVQMHYLRSFTMLTISSTVLANTLVLLAWKAAAKQSTMLRDLSTIVFATYSSSSSILLPPSSTASSND